MKAKLELIITHWREPWAICEKMFQMLDVQRGMTRDECRVTVVQDGEDSGGLDFAKLMRSYPFVTRVIRIPKSGISAARNAGIDAADAEFVMFCDCDDMFYTCDSLRTFLDAIAEDRGAHNVIYGRMLIENRNQAGRWFKSPQDWNMIFVHAKAWRLDWLRERELRFVEGLDYSEDSLFIAESAMELRPGQIRGIPEPVYMWCMRDGSCTSDRANDKRNRAHVCKHRILLPQIAQRRRPNETAPKALRSICDAFYDMTGGRISGEERAELEAKYARELVAPWWGIAQTTEAEEARLIMAAAREAAVRNGGFREETMLFRDWVQEMLKKAKG